jgi:hypothetical protein
MKPSVSESASFSSGNSLFIFEGDHILVLGEEGTEATIPLEDLKALLEHLEATATPPVSQTPGFPPDEGQK